MAVKLIVKKTESTGSSHVDEMVIQDELITIGNGDGATLFLDDSRIAEEQAVVVIENGKAVFINRAEGTILNDVAIAREIRCEIQNGDEIQLGQYTISFLNTNFRPKNSIFIPANTGNLGEPETEVFSENGLESEYQTGENNGNGLLPTKSFADILSSLRKEEDRFYFHLESPDSNEKILIEKDEMVLGWDLTGRILSADPNVVVMPRANVAKDWSGVMIHPQGKDFVWVNNEAVSSPKRLHDGDRLTFQSAFSSGQQKDVSLVFCEPAALVEINSILPQELPSVAPDRKDSDLSNPETENQQKQISAKTVKGKVSKTTKKKQRNWFGYFSFIEVIFMLLSIIITAVLVFLILEFI